MTLYEKMLKDLPRIVEVITTKALEGDPEACRLYLEALGIVGSERDVETASS